MKKTLVILLATLCCLSCDVLDQDPVSVITEKNAWRSENDVIAELHGAYFMARKALLGEKDTYAHWSYSDFRFGDLTQRDITPKFDNFDLKSDNYKTEGLTKWKNFYTAIVQCNLILEKAPTIGKDNFKQYPLEHYLGEAHFLRGFLYFYITRVWGDVPLQTKALNKDPMPREKMEKVLDFAIADAQYAVKNLPWRHTYDEMRVKAVRATRGAAYTLLSHIYMWKREDDNALAASKAVMDSLNYSGYGLMPMTSTAQSDNIFKGRSYEGIFEIDMSEEFKETGTQTIANMTLCWPPYVTSNNYFNTTYIPKDIFSTLFPATDTDRRRTLWFNESNAEIMLIKFKNQAKSIKNVYEDNLILFRLADLYLLRAEALVNKGQPTEAIRLLNDVRERAGAKAYSTTEGDLKDAVIRERRKELIGEGHIWYDMLRNGQLLKYKGTVYNKPDLELGSWTVPVAKESFITNPLLDQTPFWI